MFQDGLDDLPVFDEADDPHDSPTLRAGQGIDLVNLLNQPGPVLPVFLQTLIRFQDAGDPVALSFAPFSPADITVIPVVSDPLLPSVRNVGAHGGQPLQGIENLFFSSVFRPVNHLGRFWEILHPFLGEGGPDNVPGQVFHGGFIPGKYALTTEDLESRMPPVGKYGDQVLSNSPLGQSREAQD